MNFKNTNYLADMYPRLYRDLGADPKNSCMAFGFECGDGWFDIINRLSAKLEPLGVIASQVKEKYGTLRFYVHSATDEAWDLIDEAELESSVTCEVCGEEGETRDDGWVSTMCNKCRADQLGKDQYRGMPY